MNREHREKRRRALGVTGLVITGISGLWRILLGSYRFMAFLLFCCALAVLGFWLCLTLEKGHPILARWFKWILIAGIVAAVLIFAVTEVFILKNAAGDEDPEADVLIVLGAGVDGTVPSVSLSDRLCAALDYLERYPDARCVVTGGQGFGEEITEARCMADWLCSHGVDPARVLLEEQATDTFENLRFSFALLGEDFDGTAAVLTSDYHVMRARWIAGDMGFSVRCVGAPTSKVSLKVNYALREVAGVWKYLIVYRLFGRN